MFLTVHQRNFVPWTVGHRLEHLAQATDELIYAEIRDRRADAQVDRTDVLSLLLMAQDEDGQGLTDAELHDELLTLLFAGHETTATALTWALYWIYSRPEILEKLKAEVAQVPAEADVMTVSRLPYLTAVCNETLRIYPVGMLTFPRRAEEQITMMDYRIEPGTLLIGCIYLMHHREEIYPNSYEFRPERFLEQQFSPYAFVPFGAGSRRCVGAALAQLEMKLILATILTETHLELDTRKAVYPCRRGVTLGPSEVILKAVATG
jgi:cytochrome P450